jgi:hypothetical protein
MIFSVLTGMSITNSIADKKKGIKVRYADKNRDTVML